MTSFSLSLENADSIEGLALLISTLNQVPHLEELHFLVGQTAGKNPLDDQLIANLLKRILREKALHAFSLNLRNCENPQEWLNFFATSSAAQELNFDSCHLHRNDFDSLLATVRSNRKLYAINLFGSKIGDKNLALLLEEFAKNIEERGLLSLNLCNVGVDSESMSKLAVLLPHIKSLNISYNQVSDENIAPFLEALRSNFSLEFLDIGENNMRYTAPH